MQENTLDALGWIALPYITIKYAYREAGSAFEHHATTFAFTVRDINREEAFAIANADLAFQSLEGALATEVTIIYPRGAFAVATPAWAEALADDIIKNKMAQKGIA